MGTFGEARFKSIAIRDEEALLTTLAYVDMNVMAAGMAKTPEESAHTSVKARVEHCREIGVLPNLVETKAPSSGLTATFSPGGEKGRIVGAAGEKGQAGRALANKMQLVEDEAFWLVPIHERREHGGQRAGLCAHISLASYLQLLDSSSRLFHLGKIRVPKEAADILSRLGSSPDLWHQRLKKLREADRLFGVVSAHDLSHSPKS